MDKIYYKTLVWIHFKNSLNKMDIGLSFKSDECPWSQKKAFFKVVLNVFAPSYLWVRLPVEFSRRGLAWNREEKWKIQKTGVKEGGGRHKDDTQSTVFTCKADSSHKK